MKYMYFLMVMLFTGTFALHAQDCNWPQPDCPTWQQGDYALRSQIQLAIISQTGEYSVIVGSFADPSSRGIIELDGAADFRQWTLQVVRNNCKQNVTRVLIPCISKTSAQNIIDLIQRRKNIHGDVCFFADAYVMKACIEPPQVPTSYDMRTELPETPSLSYQCQSTFSRSTTCGTDRTYRFLIYVDNGTGGDTYTYSVTPIEGEWPDERNENIALRVLLRRDVERAVLQCANQHYEVVNLNKYSLQWLTSREQYPGQVKLSVDLSYRNSKLYQDMREAFSGGE